MARLRKNETGINITTSGAAPARRKIAETPRKRSIAQPEPQAEIATPGLIAETITEPEIESVSPISGETAVDFSPTQQDIAALAYTYWAERGFSDGNPEHDWLRAETELRRRTPVTL
jgi:hypothetical protein